MLEELVMWLVNGDVGAFSVIFCSPYNHLGTF